MLDGINVEFGLVFFEKLLNVMYFSFKEFDFIVFLNVVLLDEDYTEEESGFIGVRFYVEGFMVV